MPEECKFNPLVNLLLDGYDVLPEPRWIRPLCSFSCTHFPSTICCAWESHDTWEKHGIAHTPWMFLDAVSLTKSSGSGSWMLWSCLMSSRRKWACSQCLNFPFFLCLSGNAWDEHENSCFSLDRGSDWFLKSYLFQVFLVEGKMEETYELWSLKEHLSLQM